MARKEEMWERRWCSELVATNAERGFWGRVGRGERILSFLSVGTRDGERKRGRVWLG